MTNKFFSHLNPIAFLQTFVSQSIDISESHGCSQCNHAVNHVEQLGLNASSCFESAYRQEFDCHGAIDHDVYANMIVEIKNKIGGNFSRASSEPGMVRVVNTRCPFGEAVKLAPDLCQMTSSVFGGIAARNFGYAKVVLDKRLALGDGMCEARIYTDRAKAAALRGDEYHHTQGKIVGRAAEAEAHHPLAAPTSRAWCGARPKLAGIGQMPFIAARSLAMARALEVAHVVASTLATVLITGETGVGKEVVARAIHAMSDRWNKKFLAVNCGAIPENLVESALFGHERGAFTGAYEVHHGLFERAEGGILFLDEIDSLPLAAQARLLRVLQEGEFERVGGKQTLAADVRIVAASGRSLDKLVAQGAFRVDLFYRLNVVPIAIPPLRERREDIPVLVEHILAKLSKKYQKLIRTLGENAMLRVMSYDWPGNVRELENVLERSFLFSAGPALETVELPAPKTTGAANVSLREAKRRAADEVEAMILREALARLRGNISEIARVLGLTPRAVHQKLSLHGIDPNAYRGERKPKVTS